MHKVVGVVFLVLTLVSCDSNSVYHQYKDVGNAWNASEFINFEIAIADSIRPHNVFITVRNTYEYPYNNLFLITQLDFPNGKQLTDTLEYEMATPTGELLGKGWSDLKESKLWYKEGVRFRESGTYTLSIRHAMRRNGQVEGDTKLNGVSDVGVRIEKFKE